MDTLIGKTLGRYRLESSLGVGGMAEVYRASDDRLGRAVAVKVVLPIYAGSEEFRQRFLREARLVAALEHPNVVPIYDFGEEGGLPYLVMPLFEGGALSSRLDGAPLSPAQVARWLRDLAAALDAAHRAGVLHRDVKPSNVLIDKNGRALLADFGIALAAGVATRLTVTGTVIGTPGYMAPELAAGEAASPASDRYALGVLAYELLTGAPPFVGESPLAVLSQHATRPVPPVSTRLSGAPPGLDPLFASMLAKAPLERPASAGEFAEELGRMFAGEGTAPTLSLTGTAPVRSTAASTGAGTRAASPPSSALTVLSLEPAPGRRRDLLRALAAAALLLASAAGGAWLWQRFSAPPAGLAEEEVGRTDDAAAVAEGAADEPAAGAREVPNGLGASPPPAPPAAAGAEASAQKTPAASPLPSGARGPALHAGPGGEDRPGGAGDPRQSPFARRGQEGAGALPLSQRPRLRPRPGIAGEGGRARGEIPGREAPATEAEFLRLKERAEAAAARNADGNTGGAMSAFAEGGLAYLAGDEAKAGDSLAEVQKLGGMPVMMVAAGPLWVIRDRAPGSPFQPWELAVAFGDGRGAGLAAVDERLASAPEDLRARFGRAYLSRLHGRHELAIADAAACHEQAGEAGELKKSFLAAFLADEHAALGHWADALAWYRQAIAGGGKAAGALALEAARIAEEKLGDRQAAAEMLTAACKAGNVMACRRAEALGGREP